MKYICIFLICGCFLIACKKQDQKIKAWVEQPSGDFLLEHIHPDTLEEYSKIPPKHSKVIIPEDSILIL